MDPKQNTPVEAENPDLRIPEESPAKEDLRTDFQKRVAAWSENKWKTVQGICGAVLGAAVLFFLFGGNEDDSFSMFTLYAVVLALFVPRTLENTCGRSIRFGRNVMVITMVIGLIAYFLITGFTKGFSLT